MIRWIKSKFLWIGIGVLALILLVFKLLAKKSSKAQVLVDSLIRKQETLQKTVELHRQEREGLAKERERLQEELRENEDQHDLKKQSVEAQREERVEEILEETQADPDSLAQRFRDRFGFK
jgi:hypothetical protein